MCVLVSGFRSYWLADPSIPVYPWSLCINNHASPLLKIGFIMLRNRLRRLTLLVDLNTLVARVGLFVSRPLLTHALQKRLPHYLE
jgi:hypothetical protein